jgi:hypothetical protein
MAHIPKLRRSRGQKGVEAMSKAVESMSKADEFRQSTEEFWSKMDQKAKPVTGRRKPTLTRSGRSGSGNNPRTRSHRARAIAPTGRKTKKRTKH